MSLSDHTTLRLGGPAKHFVSAETDDELIATVRAADDAGEPLLILGGGSNVVVPDAGFDGTVVSVQTRGHHAERDGTLWAAAGERWEHVVEQAEIAGLAGIECLAGIPGRVGATPIQNVGAYGQEVSDTIISVRALDRRSGEVVDLPPRACGFGYRTSRFKREPGAFVVVRVTFALHPGGAPRPIRYGELARAVGDAPTLRDVREAILQLRAGKGMVLDPDDPDTISAGSFFTNPIIDIAALPDGAPAWPQPDGRVKTSAAWLIEHAGFTKGHGDPHGIAISSKHVLALTNRGHGTTTQLLALAREIQDGVHAAFGVHLEPEPVFVGV